MNKYRTRSKICIIAALLLSHAMCAHVAYEYCSMQWVIRTGFTSFPAYTACFLAVPYAVGILAALFLAWFFIKKQNA